MLRYGVYARKSDDDERVTEKSIGEQLAAVDEIIERDDLRVVWRNDESKSAKIPGRRPIYSELVSLIEKGHVDAILCWHINRLVRNIEEGGKLAQLVIDGVIKEIRTPNRVYLQGDNILPLVIEAGMATQQSIDLSRDVTRSMEGAFRKGGTINRSPQGYVNSRNPENLRQGIVEKDEKRFPLMRKAWDMLLTGQYSPCEILHTMNEEWGYRTKRTLDGGDTPLSASAIYPLFRNPYFAGFVRVKGELVKGKHEAMISVEEFEHAQEIMKSYARKRKHVHTFDYTGFMRCGYCGQQVTAERRAISSGVLWENYHCADSALKCTKRGLSCDKLEEKFRKGLASIAIHPGLVKLAVAQIVGHLSKLDEDLSARARQQERALELADSRIKKIEEMWIGGLLADAARYQELVKIEVEKKNAILLERSRSKTQLDHMRANVLAVQDYLIWSLKAFDQKTPDVKKQIVSALGDITFFGREKRLEFKIRPVLDEVVRFSRGIGGRLALMDIGSGSTKEPAVLRSVLYGGPDSSMIEPLHISQCLIDALEGPLFPTVSHLNHRELGDV